jgi:hypothetical protein
LLISYLFRVSQKLFASRSADRNGESKAASVDRLETILARQDQMMSSATTPADASESSGGKDSNVRVFARVRPFNERELGPGGGRECVRVIDNGDLSTAKQQQDLCDGVSSSVIVQQGTPLERTFEFDASFGPDATQATVFRCAGRSLVNEVVKGFNATILAYGQTSSGK